MNQRRLGAKGPEVGAIGLGCMGMSWIYREAERDDDASIAVIHEAIERGATLLDTADIYGDGHNEVIVGRAIADRRDSAVIATKLGLVVDDLPGRKLHRDGSPEHVRAAARASLRRLGTDTIDLLYLHRIDPQVPLADT
jgi:aryl-alcohol dehydrogenase-like predicted oxidoreductase